MYSPDVGDAAREPKANMDKKQTSKRRFIVLAKGLFMQRARLRKW
jgi:hypothetical protein